jgi:uncharacterized peroxidase-related enzyme
LIDYRSANPEQAPLLDGAQADTDMLPNLLKALAHSPAALTAFRGLQCVARDGSLSLMTRERIALAIAQQTACEYGLSAHTAAGRKAGLHGNEMAANRSGTSEDARAAVAVAFALKVSERSGVISRAELAELRQAGYSDADMLEIVTHVGLNLLTSMLAKAFDIDIDPPVASPTASGDRH